MSLFVLFFGLYVGLFPSCWSASSAASAASVSAGPFWPACSLRRLSDCSALISDPLPVGTDRGLGCIGTLFGVLGLLFLVAFLFLLLAGGMLVAM